MPDISVLQHLTALPIEDKYLLHAPLFGINAFSNKEAVKALQASLLAGASHEPRPGPLSSFIEEFDKDPLPEPGPPQSELSPPFLGIITTRSCNSRCLYCDFGAAEAPKRSMSLQTASSVVDWYSGILKKQEREMLEIHFFGGEPMAAPKVVQVVVHRAREVAAREGQIPFFEISTNGIVSKPLLGFLGDYFNTVVLSLDGPENIQNLHRPLRGGRDSFKKAYATAKYLSESSAELVLRACISNANIDKMEEITYWFCEAFNPSKINFEIMQPGKRAEEAGLFSPGPFEFAVNFIKARRAAESYGIPVIYASDLGGEPVYSSCPVGKDTIIIDPDGRISSCYLLPDKWLEAGLNLEFGRIQDNGEVAIDSSSVNRIRQIALNKPRCENCFCRWSCAGGCHVGNSYPGCSSSYSDYCIQTRIISACTILSQLEQEEKIDQLLLNRKALENLALHPTDRLSELIL